MSSVKVITFNLLSPFLCNDTEFIGYKKEHLDKNKRKQKIYEFLTKFVKEDAIICLQELSFNWKGEMELFFQKNNYQFFNMPYGWKGNGFFGIAIAIPQTIKICKTEYLHIAEHIESQNAEHIFNWEEQQRKIQREERRKKSDSIMDNLMTYLEEIIVSKEDAIKNIEDIIYKAKNRSNFAIKLTLQKIFPPSPETETTNPILGNKFIIYNYHMPCTFKEPVIQSMHIDAFKKLMQEHKEIPTIWAGDFNITPESTGYNYITNGELIPTHRIYIPQRSYSLLTLKSCLYQHLKTEPNFTCFSHTKFGGSFKDTLDYIFTNDKVKTVEADRCVLSATKMPNDVSPSDHLPIFAILEL